MSKKYKSLNFQDRKKIALWYLEDVSAFEIAMKIGVHTATIYHELKRGYTGNYDQNMRPEYDPVLAQKTLQENLRRRGRAKTKTKYETEGQYKFSMEGRNTKLQ